MTELAQAHAAQLVQQESAFKEKFTAEFLKTVEQEKEAVSDTYKAQFKVKEREIQDCIASHQADLDNQLYAQRVAGIDQANQVKELYDQRFSKLQASFLPEIVPAFTGTG